MRIRTLSLWLGGALLGFFHVSAQAEAWTLTQALTAARHYSAELSASRNEASALDAMADSARQLPDPKLKFGIENVPVQGNNDRRFTREGMTMQRVGIMQRYVSGEKRDRKAQTLIAQSRSVEAQSQTLLANLQRDTAQAWLDLALSQQALASARALVAETERQQRAQRASVGAGSSSPDSVLALKMTLLGMRDSVTLAGRDVRLAQARLLQLTGKNVTAVSGPLPPWQRLPADENALLAGVAQHPEVVAAVREAGAAKSRSAESAIAAIPDVEVELYYARRGDDYDDMAGVMFTVDLPLFQAKRQDKDHAADVSRTLQANDKLAQVERAHAAQLSALIADYQAAQAIWLRQRDEVLPLQRQRVSLLNAQYRSGQSDLSALLAARRDLLTATLATLNAEKTVAKSWAAIRYLIPQETTL
ncbi:TolC family protein [Pluralibacter gergoviae]|uniref:TolC family protein n=1 Tax=Pluralibacter gergoviae TaxID=61647 RepID=A0AAI9DJ24_PLUGE|nr:TolC family protein [Pluralibacter gergoviae]EKV0914531.1 TolC family protein [Pluralibacter gergoviae]EKV9905942.1 TolC family protein [Pluralibacter gergoviae]EKW7273857.1 TolC family protein [Pluralibacter gergoviae]ELD4293480.1 TolC family protein [Pluralibacter gergoviae]ELD4304258.1 TolC family protein [Pluralibacter gergoviae]